MEAEEKSLLENYKEELEVSELTLEMLINSHRRQRRLQDERSPAFSKAFSVAYGGDVEVPVLSAERQKLYENIHRSKQFTLRGIETNQRNNMKNEETAPLDKSSIEVWEKLVARWVAEASSQRCKSY